MRRLRCDLARGSNGLERQPLAKVRRQIFFHLRAISRSSDCLPVPAQIVIKNVPSRTSDVPNPEPCRHPSQRGHATDVRTDAPRGDPGHQGRPSHLHDRPRGAVPQRVRRARRVPTPSRAMDRRDLQPRVRVRERRRLQAQGSRAGRRRGPVGDRARRQGEQGAAVHERNPGRAPVRLQQHGCPDSQLSQHRVRLPERAGER